MSRRDTTVVWTAVALCAGLLLVIWNGDALLLRPLRYPSRPQQPNPAAEGQFFQQRNQMDVRVPRSMTVEDFIRLYRLEPSRGELLKQYKEKDLLREGSTVRVTLTPPEPVQGGRPE